MLTFTHMAGKDRDLRGPSLAPADTPFYDKEATSHGDSTL
jgi:hypothetical protein